MKDITKILFRKIINNKFKNKTIFDQREKKRFFSDSSSGHNLHYVLSAQLIKLISIVKRFKS